VLSDLTDHLPFLVPLLIKAYDNEPDPAARLGVLEAICEHRLPESVVFLGQVLETDLWKPALDGLVTIGGPYSIEILKTERRRLLEGGRKAQVRIEWIDGAIQQIRDRDLDVPER
jgi:hypothetical protein